MLPRVIAFFLPQFHPIPENDAWWGSGFTEWTMCVAASRNSSGHYQPHVPGELGYYDLRDDCIRSAQATLARQHGVHGFCYYFYWFNGRRLLERPLKRHAGQRCSRFSFLRLLGKRELGPRWDGLDAFEVLMAQIYGIADAEALMRELLAVFRDRLQVHPRQWSSIVARIYKAHLIPHFAWVAAARRRVVSKAGEAGIYPARVKPPKRSTRAATGSTRRSNFHRIVTMRFG